MADRLVTKPAAKPGRMSLKRKIAGVKVRFYKRTAGSNLSMDFEIDDERFQETTGWPHIADAERVALKRIEEIKAARLALGAGALVRGAMATVGEVCEALRAGDKVMDYKTLNRYLAAITRLARLVDAARPLEVPVDKVVDRALLERYVSLEQGGDGRGVNWHDQLEVNGAINSTLRNASSAFQNSLVARHLRGLRLPPLEPLRQFPALPTLPTHFVPWPVENVKAMDAAARALKTEQPELWLCHVMLRRLGLRVSELMHARMAWVQWGENGKAWLDVRTRKAEGGEPAWRLLKGGKPRRLALDAEIQAALRGRTGWIIGGDWSDNRRRDFIGREHCDFLRPFVPPGRPGVNHELRKLSGSEVYMQYDLKTAAYFLGDLQTTTERFYASWLGDAPVVSWEW